ncbi:DUF2716 domain-containing protein [Leptospira sp. WS58.C1]|uniref:DUF2716 domain-containing protein n=1 Tax=Leptospira cinconiae TaxID=3235173 RepID=UPI00349ED151
MRPSLQASPHLLLSLRLHWQTRAIANVGAPRSLGVIHHKNLFKMENWIPLTEDEYEEAWHLFESKYQFKPSIYEKDWPSIQVLNEDYLSYYLTSTWDETEEFDRICSIVFKNITSSDEYLYVLDWNHECFMFCPHLPNGSVEWVIPFYPDGDYYIFFPKDMRWCYFGHPWERSVTLIGIDLINEFKKNKPSIFGKILRKR